MYFISLLELTCVLMSFFVVKKFCTDFHYLHYLCNLPSCHTILPAWTVMTAEYLFIC